MSASVPYSPDSRRFGASFVSPRGRSSERRPSCSFGWSNRSSITGVPERRRRSIDNLASTRSTFSQYFAPSSEPGPGTYGGEVFRFGKPGPVLTASPRRQYRESSTDAPLNVTASTVRSSASSGAHASKPRSSSVEPARNPLPMQMAEFYARTAALVSNQRKQAASGTERPRHKPLDVGYSGGRPLFEIKPVPGPGDYAKETVAPSPPTRLNASILSNKLPPSPSRSLLAIPLRRAYTSSDGSVSTALEWSPADLPYSPITWRANSPAARQKQPQPQQQGSAPASQRSSPRSQPAASRRAMSVVSPATLDTASTRTQPSGRPHTPPVITSMPSSPSHATKLKGADRVITMDVFRRVAGGSGSGSGSGETRSPLMFVVPSPPSAQGTNLPSPAISASGGFPPTKLRASMPSGGSGSIDGASGRAWSPSQYSGVDAVELDDDGGFQTLEELSGVRLDGVTSPLDPDTLQA